MLKRVTAAAVLLATAALAADQAQLDRDLEHGQQAATIIGELAGALVVGWGFWRGLSRWRRSRKRRRAEALARAAAARHDELTAMIDARVTALLITFRKTVVETEMQATLNALRAALAEHAGGAQEQILKVSGTIETLAHHTGEALSRMEDRCNQTNDRMDEFLRALAVGQLPHFRALPRPSQTLSEG